jgi:hypothetical protein
LLEAGLSPLSFRPGFVIQEYIQGQVSGVCFSRDPRNLWNKGGCLEWSTEDLSVVQGTGQTQWVREIEPPHLLPNIPRELQPFTHVLWKAAGRLERIFSRPIDIEWVWDGRRLWLVQVRPIATEEAKLVGRTRQGRRWSRELTLERFPEALTPMGWSALEDVFASNLEVLMAGTCFGGYVYSDPDLFQFSMAFKKGIRIRWGHYFAPWRASFWKFIATIVKWIGKSSGLAAGHRKAILGIAVQVALLEDRAEKQIEGWESHRDKCLAKLDDFNQKIKNID